MLVYSLEYANLEGEGAIMQRAGWVVQNVRLMARRMGKRTRRRYQKSAVRRSLPDFTNVALRYTETIGSLSIMPNPRARYFENLSSLYD